MIKDEFLLFDKAMDDIPRDKIDDKIAFILALFCGLQRVKICRLNEEDVDTELCELVEH